MSLKVGNITIASILSLVAEITVLTRLEWSQMRLSRYSYLWTCRIYIRYALCHFNSGATYARLYVAFHLVTPWWWRLSEGFHDANEQAAHREKKNVGGIG